MVVGGFWHEVTCELVAEEVVVWEVLVESSDYPVPVCDVVSVEVFVHSVGVSEADEVEPVAGALFAVLWSGDE